MKELLADLRREGYRPNIVNIVVLIVPTFLTLVVWPFYIWQVGLSSVEVIYLTVGYFLTGLSITAYYHRVLTHAAARLHPWVDAFFAIFSVHALQGSAFSWVGMHVVHHRKTDTHDDPYSRSRGFWWSHFLWTFFNAPTTRDEAYRQAIPQHVRDNDMLRFQDRYYIPLLWAVNLGLPVLIGVIATFIEGFTFPLLIQYVTGMTLASAARISLMHHATWATNSICHTWGSRPFCAKSSARNAWFFPFNIGEQHHNYHHKFCGDYRNGVRWWEFDPTKWILFSLEKLGLAYDLRRIPDWRIQEAMEEARTENLRRQLSHQMWEKLEEKLRHKREEFIASLQAFEALKKRRREILAHQLEDARARLRAARQAWREAVQTALESALLPQHA